MTKQLEDTENSFVPIFEITKEFKKEMQLKIKELKFDYNSVHRLLTYALKAGISVDLYRACARLNQSDIDIITQKYKKWTNKKYFCVEKCLYDLIKRYKYRFTALYSSIKQLKEQYNNFPEFEVYNTHGQKPGINDCIKYLILNGLVLLSSHRYMRVYKSEILRNKEIPK